jgi:hypothetical protein
MSQCVAMKVASKSLKAQINHVCEINSQCKLATLRLKNRKVRYENGILKTNKHAPEWEATYDLSIDAKI